MPTPTWSDRSLRVALLIASCFIVPSCCLPDLFADRPPDVTSTDEAGQIRVAVLSTGLWSDYVDGLQPKFELSASQALAAVVPVTGVLDERVLAASSTSLKLGLPTTTKTAVENITAAGAPAADPGGTTTTRSTGSTAGLTLPSAGGTTSVTTLSPPGELGKADLGGIEPMLQYQAATALYQEVQLLSRYVRDAARRQGMTPYLVRLQVALMPRARNLPYDAYVNLAFFSDSSASPRLPHVVPLLVTEALESNLHAATLARLHQLALALGGTAGSAALEADQANRLEQLERALGRDLNSVLQVARLSENSLRVRLGAYQQVSESWAMVPRNHTITALVLVPDAVAEADPPRLTIEAAMDLIHAGNGRRLKEKPKQRDDREWKETLKWIADGNAACTDELVKQSYAMWIAMLGNDWLTFSKAKPQACATIIEDDDLRQLWLAMAGLNSGYMNDIVSLELPKKPTPRMFPLQTVLLLDDTKAATTARAFGGTGLDSRELCAALILRDGANVSHVLPSSAVTLERSGAQASFEFPSLRQWGLASYAAGSGAKSVRIRLARSADPEQCWGAAMEESRAVAPNTEVLSADTRYLAAGASPPAAGYTQSLSLDGVIAQNAGNGSLAVTLAATADQPTDRVSITIANALVDAVEVKQGPLVVAARQNRPGASLQVVLPRFPATVTVYYALTGLAAGTQIRVASRNAQGVVGFEKELTVK